jgi:hypothetical protein
MIKKAYGSLIWAGAKVTCVGAGDHDELAIQALVGGVNRALDVSEQRKTNCFKKLFIYLFFRNIFTFKCNVHSPSDGVKAGERGGGGRRHRHQHDEVGRKVQLCLLTLIITLSVEM